MDSINYLHIVSELRNYVPTTLQYVKVTADVYNAAQQFLVRAFNYTIAQNVFTGTRACFDVYLPAPVSWASYQIEKSVVVDLSGVLTAGRDPSEHT